MAITLVDYSGTVASDYVSPFTVGASVRNLITEEIFTVVQIDASGTKAIVRGADGNDRIANDFSYAWVPVGVSWVMA